MERGGGLRNADQALADAVNEILEDLLRDGSIESTFSRYGVRYHDLFPGE